MRTDASTSTLLPQICDTCTQTDFAIPENVVLQTDAVTQTEETAKNAAKPCTPSSLSELESGDEKEPEKDVKELANAASQTDPIHGQDGEFDNDSDAVIGWMALENERLKKQIKSERIKRALRNAEEAVNRTKLQFEIANLHYSNAQSELAEAQRAKEKNKKS